MENNQSSKRQFLQEDRLISISSDVLSNHEDYVVEETPTSIINDEVMAGALDPKEIIAEILQRDRVPEDNSIRNADGWLDAIPAYLPRGNGIPSMQERIERVRAQLRAEQNKR